MDDANDASRRTMRRSFTRRWKIRWTKKLKAQFLDHLAATCNVKAAAQLIGMEANCVHALRRRDPEFAAAWGEALAQGYQMLETRLVGHALAGGDATMSHCGEPLGPLDVGLAMQLLKQYRTTVKAPAASKPHGPPRARATRAETDASILRKLAAMEKRLGQTA